MLTLETQVEIHIEWEEAVAGLLEAALRAEHEAAAREALQAFLATDAPALLLERRADIVQPGAVHLRFRLHPQVEAVRAAPAAGQGV